MAVTEPTAYGDFVWPSRAGSTSELFNGYSYMKFDMDVKANYIVKGATSSSRALGTWSAGLNSTINITDQKTMGSLTAAIIYRIYTILVCNANLRVHLFFVGNRYDCKPEISVALGEFCSDIFGFTVKPISNKESSALVDSALGDSVLVRNLLQEHPHCHT